MKLTKHSKLRMKQRTNLNHSQRKLLFRNALLKGLSPDKVKDEKTKRYMNSKGKRCKIKLYKGYFFLYSKNSHLLYTMYKVPEWLEEVEENE